ncbi:Kae1-associated serine/threonine protein kinase [Candidatus Woesearchaeota archaeon]|jgi:TP53 regulating kinase and related kinases|nr:Kae1-associated serine/threonine protein kinase [Candidatus Woesearchaeota archaeon]MBT4368351.1 Kae1-associated serine/threonine protein kinase [Candidatus Woesearchaeota archaeon]MBT4712840.1 Kae1-associated serine/threonine protein kinase [Candidatus Woesearchaeota archaeon]MBT6639752.1 Kae1-associated serine/threonine protein kinase [Candidatus Woesearchaeota archaeon]MBT7133924.1 Kae1-associated serine/threonine protein kinase [Candidatus Woesearchaeota archaeon]
MKVIGSGAEATIKSDGELVVKERLAKAYRIKEIDDKLRKFRTRREGKILSKLNELKFPAPQLKLVDDRQMTIEMEFLKGNKLRDVLYKDPLGLGREMGTKIGILHTNDIVHGDLTTSNMIMDEELKFIDFGLSLFSKKIEDKAVDLHLLRQALESKHHTCWEDCFKEVLAGYSENCAHSNEVLSRLEKVELRGRNKH